MAGPTKRRDHGRGHSYLLDGRKARGVTTIIGAGLPKPALINWSARVVAETAVEQRDVWADMAPSAAIGWLKEAPRNDRDKAANRGTQIHRLSEQLAAGREVDVPDEIAGHVDAYLRFRDEWQPSDEILEFTVVNRRWSYMGTGDLICTMAGERWLLDLKTNRSGPFGEVALQLAAYRHAETMLDPAGDGEVPMPPVDRCGVVWLRADGYDVIPFEAGDTEFRAFLYVAQVADFLDRANTLKGEALYPQETTS